MYFTTSHIKSFCALVCLAVLVGCASSDSTQDTSTATLKVISANEMYLNNKKLDMESLPLRLKALREKNKDIVLTINCYKNVPSTVVMKVMDTVKLAGQSKINLKTKP